MTSSTTEQPAETEMSEADIIDFRAKGRRGLASFFDCYFDRVYGLTSRILGNRTEAEDVTQDIFLKAYASSHTIAPRKNVWPWLVTIACNACRDHWKSGRVRIAHRLTSIGPDTFEPATTDSDPHELSLRAERGREVRDAIAKLEKKQRMVVLLHDYEGMAHGEIAAATGTPPAAVRKQYSRGMATLARLIGSRAS